MTQSKYRCTQCFEFTDTLPCPECGNVDLELRCPNDHLCICSSDIQDGLRYCSICGEPTCKCGCHNVLQLSRITGYYADVSGYNNGKRQEIKDRKRYDID